MQSCEWLNVLSADTVHNEIVISLGSKNNVGLCLIMQDSSAAGYTITLNSMTTSKTLIQTCSNKWVSFVRQKRSQVPRVHVFIYYKHHDTAEVTETYIRL